MSSERLARSIARSPRQIEIDYSPRAHQAAFHDDDARFRVLVWHRRAGKTVATVNDLIRDLFMAEGFMPNVAYLAPQRNQAKRIAWPLFKHFTAAIPRHINAQDLEIEFPGDRRLYVLGSDNPDALRGVGLNAAVIDETAQIDPEVWNQVIRPALAEREGRCTFIGTPKGRLNLFHRLWTEAPARENWSRNMLKASASGVLPDSELQQLAADTPANEYEQEFECSFNAAITGAYYGKEMAAAQEEGRIGPYKHNKRLPTVVALDLGWADLTVAWWAQIEGNQVTVIKGKAWRHTTLADVIADIRSQGWPVQKFICPHDINVTDFQVGVSRKQLLYNLGCKVHVCRKSRVTGHDAEGIDAVRNLLPRCRFDSEGCEIGVEALVQYRSEYDALTDVQSKTPVHDWCSHWADSFRYLAIGIAAGAHLGWDETRTYDRANYRRGI